MAGVWSFPGEVLALVLLLFERFPGGRIKPLYVIAVLLHGHFDRRSWMLDVVHVLDVFERHRTRPVNVEVWLQLPVPRVRDEVEPVSGDVGAVAAKFRILAVHGGIPQMLGIGNADKWNWIELMLHRANRIILRSIDNKVLP